MVCAPVRSIIPSLKLGDYLSVQAHKPCSISHLFYLTSREQPYPYPPYHRVGISRFRVWHDSGGMVYDVAAFPEQIQGQIQGHTLPYMPAKHVPIPYASYELGKGKDKTA